MLTASGDHHAPGKIPGISPLPPAKPKITEPHNLLTEDISFMTLAKTAEGSNKHRLRKREERQPVEASRCRN